MLVRIGLLSLLEGVGEPTGIQSPLPLVPAACDLVGATVCVWCARFPGSWDYQEVVTAWIFQWWCAFESLLSVSNNNILTSSVWTWIASDFSVPLLSLFRVRRQFSIHPGRVTEAIAAECCSVCWFKHVKQAHSWKFFKDTPLETCLLGIRGFRRLHRIIVSFQEWIRNTGWA